jgi:hypothetical protein
MSIEIENAVSEILKNAGIAYNAVNRGVKKNAFGGTHSMDQWCCEFTNARSPNKPEEFDFYTGFGHRAPATKDQKIRASYEFQGLSENDKKGLTSWGKRYLARVEEMRKPVAPCAANVLHSLLLDASAVGQSFESWCNDLGYDTDSRKAFDTYTACQKNADKLNRVIPHAIQLQLSTALQDY